jgi:hypothetical protein
VVDGNGVAIAAELMDEFFHLLAKIGRAGGEWATNCHFCAFFRANERKLCKERSPAAQCREWLREDESLDGEAFDSGGRNKFRPYKHSAYL